MENFIEQYGLLTPESLLAAGSISVRSRTVTQRPRPSRKSKTTALSRLGEKLRRRLWMANTIREFSLRAQEALGRYSTYKLDAISAVSASGHWSRDCSLSFGVYTFRNCSGPDAVYPMFCMWRDICGVLGKSEILCIVFLY